MFRAFVYCIVGCCPAVKAQSVVLNSDFFATQYGVAITTLSQGQIVYLSEGAIWPTNDLGQTFEIDLSPYGEDIYTIILLDSGGDGGVSFEVNTTNLPFICGGACSGELFAGPAAAFNFSLTELDEAAGCMDETACNYDPDALSDNGSCLWFDECSECGGDNSTCLDECGVVNGPGAIYECGCLELIEGDCDCDGNQLDSLGVCGGTCLADIDEDGICDDLDDCLGTLDACGVCNGPGEIYECGCTAIPEGDCDCDGSVPPLGYDCDGECLNDADNDGVCDEFEVMGCDDEGACNFNVDATEYDGSCNYPGAPCSDGLALTFDDFLQNDCSCNGYGCIVETACNYEPEAIPSAEFCDYESCLGCTDNEACNFDLTSTLDDGSCSYSGEPCDDGNALTVADVFQTNCSCEGIPVQGCTNNQACNFNSIASIPDGSCVFPGDPCDDLNPLTFEDFIDVNCYCGNYPVVSVTMNAAPELMVFPNPANDVITIEAKAYYEPYTLSVFDPSLRLVHSGANQGQSKLDISPFAPGVYLIEVRTLVGTTRSRVLFN